MDRNNASLLDILIFMRRPLIPHTTGEKRFGIVVAVILGLLALSILVVVFMGLSSFNSLWIHMGNLLLYALLAVMVAGVAVSIVWRSRVVIRTVQERRAAGIPIPWPTKQEKTDCILYGVRVALFIAGAMMVMLWWWGS